MPKTIIDLAKNRAYLEVGNKVTNSGGTAPSNHTLSTPGRERPGSFDQSAALTLTGG